MIAVWVTQIHTFLKTQCIYVSDLYALLTVYENCCNHDNYGKQYWILVNNMHAETFKENCAESFIYIKDWFMARGMDRYVIKQV